MANSARRRSKNNSHVRTGGLILIGTGLLLLGVVSGILLLGSNRGGNIDDAVDGDLTSGGSVIPVRVNFEAPNLSLRDLHGNAVSIQDHQGKVILINNWATWCPPCKAEMPALQSFYETHQDEGFILIAIDAGDPPSNVEEFVHTYGLSFPVWLDPENQALEAFKNFGLPSSYVVDKEGFVQLAWTGAISDAMLEKYVAPLLEE
jgi:cytochrome c biogenesis protein CcmG, thiol:disulfide interchange protein DsbE